MLESFNTDKFEYKRIPIEEQKQRGILGRLAGVIADTKNPTRNGRAYGIDLWRKVFDSDLIKEKIANRCLFGEMGHPVDREETDPEKIAICLAEQPKVGKDGKIYGVFDILDTPNGRILKSLCDYGCNIGVSSRGSGDLITDYDGNEAVDPETYNCEAWDAVLVPAVKEARLHYVTESLNTKKYNKTLRQKLTEELNKFDGEKKKSVEESLDTLGIKLTESSIVTKGDSLQGEEEYEIVETAVDSLSNKTIYKIIDKEGKARWIPESDAKYIIGAPVQHEEPVEEEPIIEEPPVEELPVNESASEDLASYFNKWKEANPDVDLPALIDEYNGNLGSIMYSEAEFNRFADWAKSEHAIEINPIESDDFIDSLEEPTEEPVEEEPIEEVPEEEPTEEEPVATESLNEDGEIATQLADMGQIPQTSEGLLTEAKADTSFYVNETPYGFTEIVYKGYVITVDGSQITVNIAGDEAVEDSLESAVQTINELDANPEYHIDPWHDPSDTKVASLNGVKKLLGESMYVKKGKDFKKVEEAKKEEKAEPVDEALIENLLKEELQTKTDEETRDYFEDQIEMLSDDLFTLAKEAQTSGATKLSRLFQRMLDVLNDEQLQIDENVEDVSDKEVNNVESKELVAGLQESLKKTKKLEKDNLSLQEQLSASNAREMQLEEELARYKKATISLSKSAKETKALKEDLNEMDKASQRLAEKLTTANSKAKESFKELTKAGETNKKLTEQLEQLKTKDSETTKQLVESNDLVEKYRKSYRSLKESYVEAKAQYYGVSKDAALKLLGESYKVSDVDKTLRNLGTTKRNMSKLPIELNESVKLTKAMTVKTKTKSLDDTSIDSLLTLLD